MRNGDAAFDNGEGMIADDSLQALDESASLAEIDTVREPGDLDIRRGCEKPFDQRQRFRAVDAIRLWHDLLDLHTGRPGKLQGNITRGFR